MYGTGAVTLVYSRAVRFGTLAIAAATLLVGPGQGRAGHLAPDAYAVEDTVSQFSSRNFAVSPDGTEAALSLDGDIWLLRPEVNTTTWFGRLPLGTELTRLTRSGEPAGDLPPRRWFYRLPTWLPDGRLVYLRSIYYLNPDAEGPVDREVWLAGRQGTYKLADLPDSVRAIVPDPRGKRLLMVRGSYLRTPKGSLWLVDLETGAATQLPVEHLPAAPEEAVWSSDGESIALAVPEPNWLHLFRLEVGSGTLRKLIGFNTSTDPLTPPALAWPPGSDSLFVHLWEPGVPPGTVPPHAGILRVPVGGGKTMQALPPQPSLSWPCWSPDGRWAAYHNRSDGFRYALHVASGRSVRLGGWSREEPMGITFQWERDSRHIWYPCLAGLCRTTLPKV